MWFHKNSKPINLLSASPADSADGDLKRRVTTFLSTQHRPALRSLEVDVREGTVTLRGRVATFYEKQLSGQLARRVAGVIRLVDDVIVKEVRLDRRQAGAAIRVLAIADRPFDRGNS
jgi:hypothetical protein